MMERSERGIALMVALWSVLLFVGYKSRGTGNARKARFKRP